MAGWRPIEDLEDPRSLADGELEALRHVWAAQKRDVVARGVLEEFDKRLRREWAIETGIIENVYTLDRGVTRTLIEKGIDAVDIPQGVARAIHDHYDALEGMFDFVRGQRPLSTSYMKELHAALLKNQDTHEVEDPFGNRFTKRLEKGAYKITPNSPTRPNGSVHDYCPPEHVASEMDRLIAMHADHVARDVPPEVESAWLHHRFTQIHPFADGNGRVARAIASLIFIKAGLFPLIIGRDDWTRYLAALEQADSRDLKPLIALFVEAQRSALILGTDAVWEAAPIGSVKGAIHAVRDRLLQRGYSPTSERHRTDLIARSYTAIANLHFGMVASHLRREIRKTGRNFLIESTVSHDQVRAVEEYHALVILKLHTGKGEALTLSIDTTGPPFRGQISFVASLTSKDSPATLIPGGTFEINSSEDYEMAPDYFSPWLERVIVEGLNLWRRTL